MDEFTTKEEEEDVQTKKRCKECAKGVDKIKILKYNVKKNNAKKIIIM